MNFKDTAVLLYNLASKGINFWKQDGKIKAFIPEGESLSDSEKQYIKSNKALLLEFLTYNGMTSNAKKIILACNDNVMPLSFAQERLWFINKYEAGTAVYNKPIIYELIEDIDLDILEESLLDVISRHEILHTFIEEDDEGNAFQRTICFDEHSLNINRLLVDDADRLQTELDLFSDHVFKIDKEFPVQIRFIKNKQNKKEYLNIVVHHIAFDGWSTDIFLRDLQAYYYHNLSKKNNIETKLNLVELKVQYKDFSLWQRTYLNGEREKQQLEYWTNELSDYTPFKLIADYARPAQVKYTGADAHFEIDEVTSDKLRGLAKSCGVSLYSLLLSAYYLMLNVYSNQEDMVVAAPVANRHYHQTEDLIGFFVNTLALRINIDADISIQSFINKVGQQVIEAQKYQDVPFERIIEALGITRDASYHPLFQIMFSVQNFGNEENNILSGKEIIKPYVEEFEHKIALFDISTLIDDYEKKLKGVFNYATSLYTLETINRFITTYKKILKQFSQFCDSLSITDTKIGDLSYVDQSEHEKASAQLNTRNEVLYNRTTIIELFEKQVKLTPSSIAVSYQEINLTYQALNEKSNKLACYIKKTFKINGGELIGLFLDRSEMAIISILAILKSGGTYVPIAPDYPINRVAYILDDIKAKLLLTTDNYLGHLKKIAHILEDELELLSIDYILSQEENSLDSEGFANLNIMASMGETAYVIYTSGTTGQPKGVMITHAALANLVYNQKDYFSISQDKNILQFSALVFDASVWEIFSTLAFGARLFIISDSTKQDAQLLIDYINTKTISMATLPPALLEVLPYDDLPSLKTLIIAGEMCAQEIMNKWAKNRVLFNAYGPTESTVCSTIHKYRIGDVNTNIGKSIGNIKHYILNKNLKFVPKGVVGELYISGAGLAKGYLNKPDLTGKNFIPNLFITADDRLRGYTTLYKTGDLVRQLPDGSLIYVGRNDSQLKVHGYRVDLREIEVVLNRYPSIMQSVVIFDEGDNKSLIGYYVANDQLVEEDIVSHLCSELPNYMIPSALVYLRALPLTLNGKIDKKRLPKAKLTVSSNYHPPESHIEKELVRIWAKVLNLNPDKISINDDFFKLGGNSIKVIKLQSQIIKNLKLEKIAVADFFKYPTISALTKSIYGSEKESNRYHFMKLPETPETEIAIIGMSGAFSGCIDLNSFWKLLNSKEDGLTRLDAEQANILGVPSAILENSNYVSSVGRVLDIDLFDPMFWGVSPAEAEFTDPQIRKFLEHSWIVLEQSGYIKNRGELNIGVFAGSGYPAYLYTRVLNSKSANSLDMWHIIQSNEKDFLATRVSYLLGLSGPALNINTACSTSLVSIVEACEKLSYGRCDMAIAGGVSFAMPDDYGYIHKEGAILSKDGYCRPFDINADGTVEGSGIGVVLLKRLSDAKRDRDPIISVIRGYAVNNDGARKSAYTAPSIIGQAECILNAQRMSGLDANKMDYIECHGTGTKLGDPIEMAALYDVFEENSEEKKLSQDKCFIGSVKANIGHADSAAGVAGLLKVCKMLQHNIMLPQINYTQANPELKLNKHFEVLSDARAWVKKQYLRTAGISSFGIGGTNAHIILTEPEVEVALNRKQVRAHYVFPLSAKSIKSLQLYQVALEKFLDNDTKHSISDVAYTLQQRREHFNYRTYFVAETIEELCKKLKGSKTSTAGTKLRAYSPEVVFLSPGQGSQYANMGLELYETEPFFREIVDQCLLIITPIVTIDFKALLFPRLFDEVSKCEQDINQTQWAQLAIFIVNYAYAKTLEQLNIRMAAYIGHSLGEYVIATLAGVFQLEDVLRVVAKRGELMQSMPIGSMLSVELSQEQLQSMLIGDLEIAAINAPDCTVVSGKQDVIEKFRDILVKQNIKSVKLKTSHAFHSGMMHVAQKKFQEFLLNIKFNKPDPSYKIFSTVSGDFITDEMSEATYWSSQISKSVKFSDAIKTISREVDNLLFIEVGIGNALSTLVAQHKSAQGNSLKSISTMPSFKEHITGSTGQLDDILGYMWKNGVEIDFEKHYQYISPKNVMLPHYQFDHRSYWVETENHARSQPSDLLIKAETSLENSSFHLEDENATQIDEEIGQLFYKTLGTEHLSKHDDFFDLGGNSILATQLVSELNMYYQCKLNVADLFVCRTIEKLRDRILQVKNRYQSIIQFNKSGNTRNLIMIHPGFGGCEVYIELAQELTRYFDCYGIDSYNLYNKDKILNLRELSEYYLSQIDSYFPNKQDEYHFLGWSFGGHLALEMASMLEQRGIRNIKLYLLDTLIFCDKDSLSLIKQVNVDALVKEYQEEAKKEGYESSYIQKIASNIRVESYLVTQEVSLKLKYADCLLFKAMHKDTRFSLSGFSTASQHIMHLPYSNIDNFMKRSKIKRICMPDTHHGTILSKKNFLVSNIVDFLNLEKSSEESFS